MKSLFEVVPEGQTYTKNQGREMAIITKRVELPEKRQRTASLHFVITEENRPVVSLTEHVDNWEGVKRSIIVMAINERQEVRDVSYSTPLAIRHLGEPILDGEGEIILAGGEELPRVSQLPLVLDFEETWEAAIRGQKKGDFDLNALLRPSSGPNQTERAIIGSREKHPGFSGLSSGLHFW